MEIIDTKKEKSAITEELLKQEFAPKKKLKLQDIKTYSPKKKENEKSHKYLSDYYDKSGRLNTMQLYLSKTGIMYRFNNYALNPYVLLGILTGVSFAISVIISLICKLNCIFIPVIALAVIISIMVIFLQLNNTDNTSILMDICNIYTVLNTDISNGVFLSDCLVHMKEIVNNKRLKYALEELILNIKDDKTTIDESLILFANRFNSKEIQKLTGIIKRYITSGINDEFIELVNKQTSQIISGINNNSGNITIGMSKIIGNLYVFIMFIAVVYYIYVNIKTGMKIF